jgi:DNA-binding transcriptional ArsR family regulator
MSEAEAATAVFGALADPTRLKLVMRLSDGASRSIATLSLDTSLTRQAVTKHLRVLERVRLVRSDREGRETRFALRPEGLAPARDWIDAVGAQWEEALGRLKAFVEAVPLSQGERGQG